MTVYRVDGSWTRQDQVVVAGSPLKVFRLTAAGADVVRAIERGDHVSTSTLVDRLVDAGAIHPRPDRTGQHRFGPHEVTVVTPIHRSGPAPHRTGPTPNGAPDQTSGSGLVVIVDDGSVPPISGAPVRLDVNRGPAAARNAGLAHVTTPLVAFVDDDVTLPEGWMNTLLCHFDDDRVAVVAPRVTTAIVAAGRAGLLARHERRHSPLDLGGEPARIRAGTRVSYVPAAAIICRTAAVRAVGGFDESLRFGEDVDLVWRLDAAGWACRYEPAVAVHHAPRPTWRSWARQRIGYGSSAAPLARRHPGALAPARMSGWSAATWVIAIAGRPRAAPIAAPIAAIAVGSGSALALVRRVRILPAPLAFRLAALGNLRAGSALATAVRRVWWPLFAVGALRSRVSRRILVASFLAAGDPLVAADDVSYSIGVWRGIWRERTIEVLVPQLGRWPGRVTPPE